MRRFSLSHAALVLCERGDFYMMRSIHEVERRESWTWLMRHSWFDDVNDRDMRLIDAFLAPIRPLLSHGYDYLETDVELPGWRALFPQMIGQGDRSVPLLGSGIR